MIMGDVNHGFADAGTNKPVKIGGRARQTNPTAVADTQRVEAMFDDVGRQITVPYQVRDLVTTAYAQVTTGTPTTLLAGVSGVFLDLIEISLATSSTVASTSVIITDDSTIVRIVDIPASGTVELKFPVPLPQGATGGTWRIDMDDVTGTVLDVGALFIRNV